MKNHLIAQAMAPAARAVTAAPGRSPRMGDGDDDEDGDQVREGTVPSHALQISAMWPALPAAEVLMTAEKKELKRHQELFLLRGSLEI